VQEFEILSGDRVFVVFAQVAKIVCIVEIFEARRVTSIFLEVVADGARVLHPAVDHFLFPVPPDLKCDGWRCYGRGNHHQRDHQHQRKQNVALLRAAKPVG
jgi:hypothetical protein